MSKKLNLPHSTSRARITFPEGIENYADKDKTLQGSTVFHLAARYDVTSLKILVHFLKFKGQSLQLQEQLMTKSENVIGSTPVHIAAANHNPAAL